MLCSCFTAALLLLMRETPPSNKVGQSSNEVGRPRSRLQLLHLREEPAEKSRAPPLRGGSREMWLKTQPNSLEPAVDRKAYMFAYMHVCKCVCICTYIYIYIHTHIYIYIMTIYMNIHPLINPYVCVCVCVCVCIL